MLLKWMRNNFKRLFNKTIFTMLEPMKYFKLN